MNEPSGRKSFSHRTVFLGLALSFLGAFGVGVFIYVHYIRYERIAARHLPKDSEIALRIDLEKVVTFEPFHKHILPLFNDVTPGADRFMLPRLTRLEHWARLELAVDIREIVIAKGPGAKDYAVMIGGRFARSGILIGLQKALAEEGHETKLEREGRVLCVPAGCVGQARDGVLVLSTSAERVDRALEPNQHFRSLGLSKEGAGGIGMSAELLKRLLPSGGAPGDVRGGRLSGVMTLDANLELSGQVDLSAERAKAAIAAAKAGLSATQSPFGALLQAGLQRVELRSATPETAQFHTFWERSEADRAASALAEAVRKWSGLVPVSLETPVRR